MTKSSIYPEIQGTAAQTWGGVFVPVSGSKVIVKVKGDILESQVNLKASKQTIWTRISTVNSIEITHSPSYALIGLGVFLVLTGLSSIAGDVASLGLAFLVLGIVLTVYAWLNKRRLMVIYAMNSTVPIFMNKPTEDYEKFGLGVLAMARQLNNQATGSRPSSRPSTTR